MQNAGGDAEPVATKSTPAAPPAAIRMPVKVRAVMNRDATSQTKGPTAITAMATAKYTLYCNSVCPNCVMYAWDATET